MTAREKIENMGYEDVVIFQNFSYDDAFIGVSDDGRAVYDYDLMVECLVKEQGWTYEESVEWIDYNTIRALGYIPNSPIILYRCEE